MTAADMDKDRKKKCIKLKYEMKCDLIDCVNFMRATHKLCVITRCFFLEVHKNCKFNLINSIRVKQFYIFHSVPST